MKIEWTKVALKNIKKIHAFYKKTANKGVADKIIEPIFGRAQDLKNQSNIGQQEESLKHLKLGHRYLIVGHNKIVYIQKEDAIYITHIFDTRQNPSKLK